MLNEPCQKKSKKKKKRQSLKGFLYHRQGVIISDIDITSDDSNDTVEDYGEERRNVVDEKKKKVALEMTRVPINEDANISVQHWNEFKEDLKLQNKWINSQFTTWK